MLEFLDSIWINEIYRAHSANLINVVKHEVTAIHTIERFEELSHK
jgi:hypothetical protein